MAEKKTTKEDQTETKTKYCSSCGKKINADADICLGCGVLVNDSKPATASNTKGYKILSYIGILWIIGLLVPEKNDPKLRFHVGQGMILTVVEVVLSIVLALINTIIIQTIFRSEIFLWGIPTGEYSTSAFGLVIYGILALAIWGFNVFLLIKGIMNVQKDKEEPLPIIGKFAFFK